MTEARPLMRAVWGGLIGGLIGSTPAVWHGISGFLSESVDPEWGRGAVVIGILVLLAAVGLPGMVVGAIVGGLLGKYPRK